MSTNHCKSIRIKTVSFILITIALLINLTETKEKKEDTIIKIEKVLFTTYPFKSTNPGYDLIKQINKWFSKKLKKVTNPSHWPGEEGKAVIIPENMKIISDKRFKENQFNIIASDMIALDRKIPDKRAKG